MSNERRGPTTEQREQSGVIIKQYQARIISGNFDVGKPLDLGQVGQRIVENNPIEAYARMHERWLGVRVLDWNGDNREFSKQVFGWARGRAASLLPQLQSNPSADLLDGLKTIGLEISDPITVDKDTLKRYFAETFYLQFACQSTTDDDKSVGNLVRTFFDAARVSSDDPTSGLDDDKLQSVRAQVEALKPVLEPILKTETFEKFEEVLEARFAAAKGELSVISNGEPSASLIEYLEYFQLSQTSAPEPVVVPRPQPVTPLTPWTPSAAVPEPEPESTPRPVGPFAAAPILEPVPWRTTRAASAPVEGVEPLREDIVLIDSDPGEFNNDLSNAILVAGNNNKHALVTSVSPEALILGEGYLLSDPDGDLKVEVKDPGTIEVIDGEDGIKETGVTLFVEDGGKGREIQNINLSIRATEDGINISIDDIEEDPGFADWNRQLVEKALAHTHARLVAKINGHLKDNNLGWMVTGKLIIESGRFRISFAKSIDDELEPETPPPFPSFPKEADVVFPGPDDEDAVGSV